MEQVLGPVSKGGPGRHSKGDRDQFAVRPPRAVGNVIRARADALRMTYGEYCAALLAQAVGMPELAPQPPTPATQPQLPLKSA